MLLGISFPLLLLPFISGQDARTASSSVTDTTSTSLSYTLLLSLKQIHDALEPLQQMREDLTSMASHGSHVLGIGCPPEGTNSAKDCSQLYQTGYRESGVYVIYSHNAGKATPISVYCDMETDGGGWLVFQRREDGSVYFYRDWTSYVDGFGNITGEFWLGNELLHQLTGRKPQQLRVELHDHEGHTAYAKYGNFYVGPEMTKFALNISGYSGTAGDGMAHNNNQMFSTKDQDNDNSVGSCAIGYKGAWWYGACSHSSLNALYAQTGSHNMTKHIDHVYWSHWRGYRYSLKFTEMKIRPHDF